MPDPTEDVIKREIAEAARILREDGHSVRLANIEAKLNKHFPDEPETDPKDGKDGPNPPDKKTQRNLARNLVEESGGGTRFLMSSDYPRGIDVSNNNDIFDWPSWRGYIEFASAKATEGLDFQDEHSLVIGNI